MKKDEILEKFGFQHNWGSCAILPRHGIIAIVLLVWDDGHQLKGERSGTQVPLYSSDRLIGTAKRDAVLGFLGD